MVDTNKGQMDLVKYTNVVYSYTYQGRLWVAYVKVRIKALLKDWSTSGAYYGVGWRIKKES